MLTIRDILLSYRLLLYNQRCVGTKYKNKKKLYLSKEGIKTVPFLLTLQHAGVTEQYLGLCCLLLPSFIGKCRQLQCDHPGILEEEEPESLSLIQSQSQSLRQSLRQSLLRSQRVLSDPESQPSFYFHWLWRHSVSQPIHSQTPHSCLTKLLLQPLPTSPQRSDQISLCQVYLSAP